MFITTRLGCGHWSRWVILSGIFLTFGHVGYADAFLKIDDIDGESKAAGYEGWIDVESFAAGIGSSVSDSQGSTRTRVAAMPESLKIEKRVDAASPYLFLASAQQALFDSVVLESNHSLTKESGARIRHEFSNAGVVAVNVATDVSPRNRDSIIHESVEFDFEEWAVHCQRPGLDEIAATWNFFEGTGGLIGNNAPGVPQIEPFDTLVANPGVEYSVSINLSDRDTPVEELSLRAESLDPEKVTIVGIEGVGAERSLTILVSDFFSGSASVLIWVSDDFQSSSRTLMLSIEGGDTPYETFLLAAFGEKLLENSELGLPIGDPDNDGLRTIAEFYLGTDPNLFTARGDAIDVEQVIENGEVETQLHFFRRSDTDGLAGRFLLSSNLKDWTDLGQTSDPVLVESVSQTDGPYEQVNATIKLSLQEWEKYFLRLQVDGAF